MCGPYITAAGAVVGAAAQVSQGFASRRAARYNARLAEQQADIERQKAEIAEARSRRQNRLIAARRRLRLTASGVTLEGSPGEVLADDAGQYEYDAQLTRWVGAVNADALEKQADAARYRGRTSLIGRLFNAGATLLTGAGTAYDQYSRLRTPSFGGTTGGPVSQGSAPIGPPVVGGAYLPGA